MICHFDRENGKSPIGMDVAHEERKRLLQASRSPISSQVK